MRFELPFRHFVEEWNTATLGEICDRGGGDIQTGPFGSQLHADDYVEDGVPSIMPQNIIDGRIELTNIARITEGDAQRLKRYRVCENDIVYSRRGDIRRRTLIRGAQAGWLCGTGCLRIRAGSGVDAAYLVAYLGHPAIQGWIERHAVGVTMPNLNTDIVSSIPVVLPTPGEQIHIAAILDAFDDKIDSNRRLATLLGEAAAILFRTQFVDFAGIEGFDERYLPHGWCINLLGSIAVIVKESIEPTSTPDALFQHFSIPAFDQGHADEVCGRELLSNKTCLPDGDCVLLSKLNPATKRVWWPRPTGDGLAVGSPEFLVLVPQSHIPNSYLYTLLMADERFYDALLARVSGTTGSRQRVKPTDVLTCQVIVPDADTLAEWDRLARPMYDQISSLSVEQQTLAALRDTLLPKLISGEIRVPDTTDPEEVIGPAAEQLAEAKR